MTGQTISHYQIAEKLGEGGMGVVYKARDTSLDRYVALKLLPADKLASPERKQRFIQEAKAASALNHPNIITVHEISGENGVDFIVMEYVAGKTLDALIPRSGMRLNEALKYAVQIADALAAAHAAGIIHRDIKPSNIIIGDDGRVRVLDFGLAKLAERPQHTSPVAATITVAQPAPVTGEGTVLGTPNYMSPEQAQGLPIDARSDIFSFGAVLYEMLTGRRAFQADSAVTTMAAIVQEEPEPLPAEIPLELRKLIERSLRKDPGRRWSDMRDVRVTLEDLKDESNSGRLQPVPEATPSQPNRTLRWLAVAAVSILVVVGWFFRPESGASLSELPATPTPLTAYPGQEVLPSFSPEGERVAFAGQDENRENWDIYVKLVGQETTHRLTDHHAEDTAPAWSPDGKWIAFERRDPSLGNQLLLIPSIGGPERPVIDGLCGFGWRSHGWYPDSQHLVVSLRTNQDSPCQLSVVSLNAGEALALTSPPSGIRGDLDPAVSPNGLRLVFRRSLRNYSSEVFVLDLPQSGDAAREPRHLAAGFSPIWTIDGQEIIFATGVTNRLWRVSANGGEPRAVLQPPEGPQLALSPVGRRAAFVSSSGDRDIWRARFPGGEDLEPLISSTYTDANPKYSPDGSRIAFSSSRSGHREIWISERDGSNPVRLTSLKSAVSANPSWSPDGTRIVFDSLVDNQRDIFVVRANGSNTERLTDDPSQNAQPSWSQNSQWVYFSSNRSGETRIWRIPAAGGQAEPVTSEPAVYAAESLDGHTLYYSHSSEQKLWSIPVRGGEPTVVIDGLSRGHNFDITRRGILFARPDRRTLAFYDFSTKTARDLFELPRRIGYGLSASPDGSHAIFTQAPPREADIMLMENFR